MATQELLKAVRDAGVVGAGGAGFPTYKKLEANVSHIIANGAECEPLLHKDRESMRRDQQAFFRGSGRDEAADRCHAGHDRGEAQERRSRSTCMRRRCEAGRLRVLCLRGCVPGGRRIRAGVRNHRPSDPARRSAAACRLRGGQRRDDHQRRQGLGRLAGDRQVCDHHRRRAFAADHRRADRHFLSGMPASGWRLHDRRSHPACQRRDDGWRHRRI